MNPFKHLCRLFVYAIVPTLLFSACKKDKDAAAPGKGDYYFKATFNGKEQDFSHTANYQGMFSDDGRLVMIVVGGHTAGTSEGGSVAAPSFDFEIWRTNGNITAGTYDTRDEAEGVMISRYAIQSSGGTILYNTIPDGAYVTVKIDEISNKGIKGTLSGVIINESTGESITVTNGSFNFPYETVINP